MQSLWTVKRPQHLVADSIEERLSNMNATTNAVAMKKFVKFILKT